MNDQLFDGANSPSRREFVTRMPGVAAMTLVSTAVPSVAPAGLPDDSNGDASARVMDSFQIRLDAARAEAKVLIPRQITNRDGQKYPNFIGNYHKGLPHNAIGEVDTNAYLKFLNAVSQGTAGAFELVPLGGNTKLVNPLAGVAFDLEGTDSHQFAIPPFPAVSSQALADQAVELYWMALCRDVNFLDYATNPLAQAAAGELSNLTAFTGLRSPSGKVTPQTLFRGFTKEDVIGPYVSQFLVRPFNYGPYAMSGTMGMYVPGIDYMTDQASWLAVQNGQGPFASNILGTVRYTCTGRDLTVYVHKDPHAGLLISFYNAGIWLFEQNAPLNSGNRYTRYAKQAGFATFGVPHFLCLLGEAKQRACKAAWYAKWFVHRALRPEEYGGLVHMTASAQAHYPLYSDILHSKALANVFAKNGTYFPSPSLSRRIPATSLLPARSCDAFDGSVQFNTLSNGAIMTASEDGLSLIPYTGSDANQITVNGRSTSSPRTSARRATSRESIGGPDYESGLRLGEAAAISVLSDQSSIFAGEDFEGFTITTFDGKTITV